MRRVVTRGCVRATVIRQFIRVYNEHAIRSGQPNTRRRGVELKGRNRTGADIESASPIPERRSVRTRPFSVCLDLRTHTFGASNLTLSNLNSCPTFILTTSGDMVYQQALRFYL